MSFMDILKARNIQPFLYDEAKRIGVNIDMLHEAYDASEKDSIKDVLGTNPFKYAFKSITEGKKDNIMYTNARSKFAKKAIQKLKMLEKVRLSTDRTLQSDIGLIQEVLEPFSEFKPDSVKGNKTNRKLEDNAKLLQDAFKVISTDGFREESKDLETLKRAGFEKIIPRVRSFFTEGRGLGSVTMNQVMLDNTNAEWDEGQEDWMLDGSPSYREYNGKTSKELFIELEEGLGFSNALSSKDISQLRESLLEHFELDFESLVEELMTILPKNANEYTDENKVFLFNSNMGKLESILIDVAMEVVELQDKLEPHLRQPPKSELDSVEKYIDVVEYIVAVLKLRGQYVPSPNIEQPLSDIDEPRDVDLNREFPELKIAAQEFLTRKNVKRINSDYKKDPRDKALQQKEQEKKT